MGKSLAYKILENHLKSGKMIPGEEISIGIDYTLTQDSTGTMAYLQFEAMGVPRVKTKKSVAYIDHNTLQSGFENADDHKYIQTAVSYTHLDVYKRQALISRIITYTSTHWFY